MTAAPHPAPGPAPGPPCPTLWLDGRLVPAADARIAPDDRGLLLADGVFETVALRAGGPRHPLPHLARLRAGAAALGIPVPFPDRELLDALSATAWANARPEGSLRLTLTRGPGPRGLLPPIIPRPTLLIASFPPSPPLPRARLVVSTTTRRNEHSPLSRIKSLCYADNLLARREAEAHGADDALLLNTAGRLACATAANVLLRTPDHRWLTPPLSDGALPGIARGILLAHGLVAEARIDGQILREARCIILCNSLSLRDAVSLDDRPLDPDPPALDRFAVAA